MTAYQKAKGIREIILARAGEVMNYEFDSDLSARNIKGIYDQTKDYYGSVNVNELSRAEMIDLEFKPWSTKSNMLCIPLWLYQFLPEEIECEFINGKKVVMKTSEMDIDHRGGLLAYGVVPKE